MPRKATAKTTSKAKKAPARKKVSAVRKTTARKTTAKVAAKRAPAKKTAPAKAVKVPTTAISEAFTKSQLLNEIAAQTGTTRKQVSDVLASLGLLVERHVKKRAVGQFTLPGLLKIVTTRKPATKARKGINPFTGEETVFKAKPARTVVKIRALKKLKDMVA